MVIFIVSAIVLVLIAVVFIIPALLKENHTFSDEYDDLNVEIAKERLKEIKLQFEAGDIDEETYQQLHDELESTLALDLSTNTVNTVKTEQPVAEKSKTTAIVLSLIVPVLAAGIYYELGDFGAATGTRLAATVIPAADDRPEMTIEDAVLKLEQRLTGEPNNPDGWYMLAKTYMTLKQYDKAVTGYEKLIELVGEDPKVLIGYADALAMSEGGRLTGKAKPVVDKVIALLPDNPTALWMAGTTENQQGNHSKALSYWYKLHPLLAQEPSAQAELSALIKQAESQLTPAEIAGVQRPVATAVPTQPVIANAPASASNATQSMAEITVTVDLDPALKDKAKASDILFIFAKAMQGPPMPLAAVRKTVADLPITVKLNDSMAMMPQMKLSNFKQVKVSAVISKSGQPGKQPGDLFVEVLSVDVNSGEKLVLLINQIK